jgi:hypothetical protein
LILIEDSLIDFTEEKSYRAKGLHNQKEALVSDYTATRRIAAEVRQADLNLGHYQVLSARHCIILFKFIYSVLRKSCEQQKGLGELEVAVS